MMNDTPDRSEFRVGDPVFWWKRYRGNSESPYHALIVAVGDKRITIEVDDPDANPDWNVRHVTAGRLQHVAPYCGKAPGQGPRILEPAASWGRFTRYLDVGEDLQALRHVDVFNNGNMLSYDRNHWVDAFGMLADARINRNDFQSRWEDSEEIGAEEFQGVWEAARQSTTWQEQVATAQMKRLGQVPPWFTIIRYRPPW